MNICKFTDYEFEIIAPYTLLIGGKIFEFDVTDKLEVTIKIDDDDKKKYFTKDKIFYDINGKTLRLIKIERLSKNETIYSLSKGSLICYLTVNKEKIVKCKNYKLLIEIL